MSKQLSGGFKQETGVERSETYQESESIGRRQTIRIETMGKRAPVQHPTLKLHVAFKEWDRSTDLKAQDLMYT